MSDERSGWVSPGDKPASQPADGTPSAQPTDRPQYGEYAPPGWTPPTAQQGPYYVTAPGMAPGPAPAGWRPPPKPGLIPLRPLGLGDVTAAAFQVIRRNPRPTFGFALLISLVIGVAAAGIVGAVTWLVLGRVTMASAEDVETIQAGGILLIALSAFVAAIVQLALSAIPQGVVAWEVARGTLGEKQPLRELWRRVRPRIGALIGWTLLLGGALLVLIVVAALAILPLATGGIRGVLAAIGIALLVGGALLAVSIWIGTKLEFVPPLILIERLPIGAAVRRSWSMTRGHFWRVFGITLLVNLIVQLAAQIVTTPVTLIGGFVATLVNPNQSVDAVNTSTLIIAVVSIAIGIVLNGVIIVAQSAVPTLLYLDVRMRKEGLDLVLQRYVESPGDRGDQADPFDGPVDGPR